MGSPRVAYELSSLHRATRLVRAAGERHRFAHHALHAAVVAGIEPERARAMEAALGQAMLRRGAGRELTGAETAFACTRLLAGAEVEAGEACAERALRYLIEEHEDLPALERLADLALRVLPPEALALRCRVRLGAAANIRVHRGPTLALPVAEAAVADALATGDAALKLESDLEIAWLLTDLGQLHEARDRARMVARDPAAAADVVVTALCAAAQASRALGSFDEAFELLREAIAVAERSEDGTGLLLAESGLAIALIHSDRQREALVIAEKNVAAYRNIGLLPYCQSLTIFSSALQYIDPIRAFEISQRAHDVARAMGSDASLATCAGNLANSLARLGHGERALSLYAESLELHALTGGIGSELHARIGLAFTLRDLGRLDAARETHAQALDTAQRVGSIPMAVSSCVGRALVEEWAGDLAAAQAWVERGLAMGADATKPGASRAVALAHNQLGRIAWREGKRDQAVAHLERALQTAPEMSTRECAPPQALLFLLGARSEPGELSFGALRVLAQAETRWMLHVATGEDSQLDTAWRLVEESASRISPENRETFWSNVPVARDVRALVRRCLGLASEATSP